MTRSADLRKGVKPYGRELSGPGREECGPRAL